MSHSTASETRRIRPKCSRGSAQVLQIFDLFGEDSWRRLYTGELEVRQLRPPPGRERGSAVYSARRTFTGSSRKARHAGTRLAMNAIRARVADTAASVCGYDALTPKTSALMTFAV